MIINLNDISSEMNEFIYDCNHATTMKLYNENIEINH